MVTMQTPFDPLGFALNMPPYFGQKPGTPFNDAVLRIAQMSLADFSQVNNWLELFPYPPFESTQVRTTFPNRVYGKTVNEQRLEWEIESTKFFNACKKQVNRQFEKLKSEFKSILDSWASRKRPIIESPESILNRWLVKNGSMPISQFCHLNITAKLVLPFYQDFAERWERDRGLVTNSQYGVFGATKPDARVVALLYVYTGDIIDKFNCEAIALKYGNKSGQHMLTTFEKVRREGDRRGFAGESTRKVNAFLRDIEKAIPYLTEIQRLKAKEDINFIEDEIRK